MSGQLDNLKWKWIRPATCEDVSAMGEGEGEEGEEEGRRLQAVSLNEESLASQVKSTSQFKSSHAGSLFSSTESGAGTRRRRRLKGGSVRNSTSMELQIPNLLTHSHTHLTTDLPTQQLNYSPIHLLYTYSPTHLLTY